jgi:thiol-disulfide isomerase/thioredoxin
MRVKTLLFYTMSIIGGALVGDVLDLLISFYVVFILLPGNQSDSSAYTDEKHPTESISYRQSNQPSDEIDLLLDQEGVLFINLWATWCGPCIAEFPSIDSLEEKLEGKVQFLIATHQSVDQIQAFQKARPELSLNFVSLTSDVPLEMTGTSIPRTYILRNGKIMMSEFGARNWNTPEVQEYLEKLVDCAS